MERMDCLQLSVAVDTREREEVTQRNLMKISGNEDVETPKQVKYLLVGINWMRSGSEQVFMLILGDLKQFEGFTVTFLNLTAFNFLKKKASK